MTAGALPWHARTGPDWGIMPQQPRAVWKCVRVKTDPKQLRAVGEEIVSCCRTFGFPEEDLFAVRLGYEEATANAARHGNRNDPEKVITIQYEVSEEQVWIRISDEGPGFDPDQVPDPTLPQNLDRPSGRGLMLMKHYMETRFVPPGNTVELVRRRSGPATGSNQGAASDR